MKLLYHLLHIRFQLKSRLLVKGVARTYVSLSSSRIIGRENNRLFRYIWQFVEDIEIHGHDWLSILLTL